MESGKVSSAEVKAFYEDPSVVDHYRRATANIGLWLSEELVFRKVFQPSDRLIELGCGTGRIAVGLAEIGYEHVLGTDLARDMVKEARHIAKVLELPVYFRQGDATRLKFEDNLFDGAIFGFNGLMQIPGRENRRTALREIRRVVRPGGALVFTTHDRNNSKYSKYWKGEKTRWDRGKQDPQLLEFGDRYEETNLGKLFIHVPVPEEIREDLQAAGWKSEWDSMRSSIARESPAIQEFSDDCRFWVARNPVEDA